MHAAIATPSPRAEDIRHDWTREEVAALFALPFNDLLFRAHSLHRAYFDPNQVQVSTLLSIKTGACPEDCAYCPQSTRYDTGLEVEKLMEVEKVLEQARAAKAAGSTRFCMGAAWRSPKARDMPHVVAMVKGVRDLGMETCRSRPRSWPRLAWITTTTTWIPRPSFTVTLSPLAPTRTGWIRWNMCATPA